MRSRQFGWLLVAAAVMVAMLAPLPAGAAESPLEVPIAASLTAEAQATGSVEVIVQLDSVHREGAVLEALAGAGFKQMREYDKMPYMALDASPEALRRLAKAAGVRAISENTLSLPHLASTIPIINADDVHTLGWTGGWANCGDSRHRHRRRPPISHGSDRRSAVFLCQ